MEGRLYTRWCTQCEKYFKSDKYYSELCKKCKDENKTEYIYKNQLKRLNLVVAK